MCEFLKKTWTNIVSSFKTFDILNLFSFLLLKKRYVFIVKSRKMGIIERINIKSSDISHTSKTNIYTDLDVYMHATGERIIYHCCQYTQEKICV